MQTIRMMAILMAATTEMLAADGATTSRRLIVNLAARKIVLVEDGNVVKMYQVAIGKASTPSPTGTFHIASHVINPTYYHAGKVVRPGPANPVGTRWMGLGYKGYGIHGTNHPESIGHAASHGCIRMRKHDIEELFRLIQVGDEVELTANPNPQEAALFNNPAPIPAPERTIASAATTVGGLQ